MFGAMKEWNLLPNYVTQQKNDTKFKDLLLNETRYLLAALGESQSLVVDTFWMDGERRRSMCVQCVLYNCTGVNGCTMYIKHLKKIIIN